MNCSSLEAPIRNPGSTPEPDRSNAGAWEHVQTKTRGPVNAFRHRHPPPDDYFEAGGLHTKEKQRKISSIYAGPNTCAHRDGADSNRLHTAECHTLQ